MIGFSISCTNTIKNLSSNDNKKVARGEKMKKNLTRGLLSITLLVGIGFIAPQVSLSAPLPNTKTVKQTVGKQAEKTPIKVTKATKKQAQQK